MELSQKRGRYSPVSFLGHAEVWTHTREDLKLQQFGWRCTTKESSYGNKTLTGNWNEERSNYDKVLQNKPLPSQVPSK